MIVTIRELNAFGNVLEHEGRKELAKEMHSEVSRMIECGINEIDIEADSQEGKKLYDLIKKAEIYLTYSCISKK